MCVCVCVGLTVNLQHFGSLLWLLCEGHMVHFAGVGHSIISSVHVQLQGALHRERLPACIHLFGTCNERSAPSRGQIINLAGWDGYAAECVMLRESAAIPSGSSAASFRFCGFFFFFGDCVLWNLNKAQNVEQENSSHNRLALHLCLFKSCVPSICCLAVRQNQCQSQSGVWQQLLSALSQIVCTHSSAWVSVWCCSLQHLHHNPIQMAHKRRRGSPVLLKPLKVEMDDAPLLLLLTSNHHFITCLLFMEPSCRNTFRTIFVFG